MKSTATRFSRQYAAALQEHLKQGLRPAAATTAHLGRQALADGLETLDLVRIHESALARMVSPSGSSRLCTGAIKRAARFFAEVVIPIEQTHRAALKANAEVKQLARTLGRRSVELVSSQRELSQGIARRKTAEHALQRSEQHHARLLAESRRLQKHLRRLAHQILSAQEDERKQISRQLHDDIAQTLLGIDVRLLALKAGAASNAQGLQNEIASTERLVENSTQTMRRFAREFRNHHEA